MLTQNSRQCCLNLVFSSSTHLRIWFLTEFTVSNLPKYEYTVANSTWDKFKTKLRRLEPSLARISFSDNLLLTNSVHFHKVKQSYFILQWSKV